MRKGRDAIWRSCALAAIAWCLVGCAAGSGAKPGAAEDEELQIRDPAVRAAVHAIRQTERTGASVTMHEVRRDRAPVTAIPAADVAPEIGTILAHKQLTVAMLGVDNPPFFVHDAHGKLSGFDVDIARDIASRLDVPLVIDTAPQSFNAVVEAVARGHADLGISKLSRTLPRARLVRFSVPYVAMHRALLVNRVALARLGGHLAVDQLVHEYRTTLGVIGDSSYEAYAKASFPQATLVRFPTWDAELAALERGEVVAVFRDEFEIKRVLRRRPSLALVMQPVVLVDTPDALAIAVSWNHPTLLAYVDQLMTEDHLVELPVDAILEAFPTVETPS